MSDFRILNAGLLIAATLYLWPNKPAPTIQNSKPNSISQAVKLYASKNDIPSGLILAIIKTESQFNPAAKRYEPKLKSHSLGLMQVMANYWVNSPTCPNIKHESDLLDPDKNIGCGSKILSNLLNQYASTHEALIAYNGGSGCFKSAKCLKSATQYALKVSSFLK